MTPRNHEITPIQVDYAVDQDQSGRLQGDAGRGNIYTTTAGLGVVGVGVLLLASKVGLDFPSLPDGGRDDPAPQGQIILQGQKAENVVEDFTIKVGDGRAIAVVKAKQDHDMEGNIFSGDWQPTNGTSSVRKPGDTNSPANLEVYTEYCVNGNINKNVETDLETGTEQATVTFNLGEIFVCDAILKHTPDNDAAFNQDDTPNDFHGKFVSFVSGAAETSVKAMECPEDELRKYYSPAALEQYQRVLVKRFNLPESQVIVNPGEIGKTDDKTKQKLMQDLESYANMPDPDNPDKTNRAFNINFFGPENSVEGSCYINAGATPLTNLESYPFKKVQR